MAKRHNAPTRSQSLTHGNAQILEFVNGNWQPEDSRQRAAAFLSNREIGHTLLGLTPQDQARFLDKVDEAYPTLNHHNARYISALGNACSATLQLPSSTVHSTTLEKRGNIAVASGGFTDIWRGDLNGLPVAIKAFRIYPAQNLKEAKEILWKRLPLWIRLSHPNVLQFRGVNMTLFQLCLVYDWGHYGNITQYIASHPRAPRPTLLLDVANGLEYLHSLDIPHGDLKGANVIIDRKGRARLTEYGLAPINSDPSFTVAATPGSVGTSRWLAPEIITPTRRGGAMPMVESKSADVFAFGMFAVEVFTGKIPFEQQRNETAVLRISQGGRPEMPGNAQALGLTPGMWDLLESCWQENPKRRPTMEEVVRRWQRFVEEVDNLNTFPEELQSRAELGEGPSRRRIRTEATPSRFKAEAGRNRTMSEAGGARQTPRSARLRTMSASVKVETGLGAIPQSPVSEVQESPRLDVTREPPKAEAPKEEVYETPEVTKKCCCVIM